MINLKIDPEFQSQIPPLTDDEFKQLEENILKAGKLLSPLIVWNNTLVDGHNRYAILQKHPEIYFSTMPLRFANREEALIGSPVETATTSTRLLPRKPPRRNCVKLTQFLPLPQKQAFVSRLRSGTMSANPTLPVLKNSCAA